MIHISQFYACSRVSLACELYYIIELGKYLKYDMSETLSLDGVILEPVLKKSPFWSYFRVAIAEGWIAEVDGVKPATEKTLDTINVELVKNLYFGVRLLSNQPVKRDVFQATPIRYSVSFETMTDAYWLWSANGKDGKDFSINNGSMNRNCSEQNWLSLIAMVAVHRLHFGNPDNLLLNVNGNMLLNRFALSYIMLLTDETNCLDGWCFYHIDDNVPKDKRLQLGYHAWYIKGRDMGFFTEWSTGKDKLSYMKKLDIVEGDLVMFYERDRSYRNDIIKTVSSCHLAKVVKLSSTDCVFELIHTSKTYFHGEEDFAEHTMAVKAMYMDKPPYERLNTSRRSVDLAMLGVDYLLFDEGAFILTLDKCDDVVRSRVTDGFRKDTILLSQNDLVYWILKDYDYTFNEERFLSKYFKDRLPARTSYLDGEFDDIVFAEE